jgi:DNA (cytosine-5)-methyltransferase 1
MTAFSRLSRFGMTFKPLTESLGQDVLTSYLEAFPARTLAQPDEAQELTEKDRECGHTWQELLARYDQDTSSWKTPQSSLLEDSTVFLGTWPRWGLMRDGVSYQQQTLVPPIKEIGSGSWPTPTASAMPCEGTQRIMRKKWLAGQLTLEEANAIAGKDVRKAQGKVPAWPTPTVCGNYNKKGLSKTSGDGLATAVAKWPTPQASDNKQRATANSTARRMELGKQISLEAAVKFWPTPTAHNAKEGAYPAEFSRNTPTLSAQAGGTLNPTWVEWLMGWPLEWTDLKPLAMDKYHLWLQQHGGS